MRKGLDCVTSPPFTPPVRKGEIGAGSATGCKTTALPIRQTGSSIGFRLVASQIEQSHCSQQMKVPNLMSSAAFLRSPSDQTDLFAAACSIQFPSTRYQGSKRKLVEPLKDALAPLPAGRALDLYSGTGTVSLLLRSLGHCVTANDYLAFNALTARIWLQHLPMVLEAETVAADLKRLIEDAPVGLPMLVRDNYEGVFFTDVENEQIDRFCQNVVSLPLPIRDVYTYAVGQALLMKRPYNLFHRANLHMRLKDVPRSFGNAVTWEKSIKSHAVKIVGQLNNIRPSADGLAHTASNRSSLALDEFGDFDLVYLDPPYLNRLGQSTDYDKFYHFLDGLSDYSRFGEAPSAKRHLPSSAKPSAWATTDAALKELKDVSDRWPQATLALSYRSDGLPTLEAIEQVFRAANRSVTLVPLSDYKYALAHSDRTVEILALAGPVNA